MTKAVETDLQYRSRPLPRIRLKGHHFKQLYNWDIEITTDNAPLKILSIAIEFAYTDGKVDYERCPVEDQVLRLGEVYKFSHSFTPTDHVVLLRGLLRYKDLTELHEYSEKVSVPEAIARDPYAN